MSQSTAEAITSALRIADSVLEKNAPTLAEVLSVRLQIYAFQYARLYDLVRRLCGSAKPALMLLYGGTGF